MASIQFCTEARLASSAILHACQVIDDHARGIKTGPHAIKNVQQELNFLIDMSHAAYDHLGAIMAGTMTSEQAKGLK